MNITITVLHSFFVVVVVVVEETPAPKTIAAVTLTLHHRLHGCIIGAGWIGVWSEGIRVTHVREGSVVCACLCVWSR